MPKRDRKCDWLKVSCGPIEPINERMRLKLLISDELKRKRQIDTPMGFSRMARLEGTLNKYA